MENMVQIKLNLSFWLYKKKKFMAEILQFYLNKWEKLY